MTEVQQLLHSGTATELVAFLKKADIAYYNTSKPIISDEIYDRLEAKLRQIAPKNPYLKKIGAPSSDNKVILPYGMASLDKIRDDEKSLQKWKSKYTGQCVISDKLDGNSGLLVYSKNSAVQLYSRGDGTIGQNISHLLKYITIPELKDNIAVRGELIFSRNNWTKIHATHPDYANPRNLVAGIMHSKTPDPIIAKDVEFVAYELLSPKMIPSLSMAFFEENGFNHVYHYKENVATLSSQLLSDKLVERKRMSPYEIDGIVVYHDDIHRSIKGSNPKYAFAFKTMLTHTEAEVIVNEVSWNVSKDGYLKPTVLFDSVTIDGVKIQKATGFNAAYIENNGIGPGAKVIIIRSGDVIPHILRVEEKAIAMFPKDIPYEWNDTHIDIKLSAFDTGLETQGTFEHFAKSLEIKFVAAGTIKKLIEAGFNTIPKLLDITVADLLKIDGFKQVSAEKIANSLNNIRHTASCVDLMIASNIFGRGLGKKKLHLIVKELPQILKRKEITLREIEAIDGFGKKTALAFLEGIQKFYKFMDDAKIPCRDENIQVTSAQASAPSLSPAPPSSVSSLSPAAPAKKSFKDMKIVFSGFRNKDWERLIENNGGKVATSVSKNTSLVVVSSLEETSSKIARAHELGVSVISKDTFNHEFI